MPNFFHQKMLQDPILKKREPLTVARAAVTLLHSAIRGLYQDTMKSLPHLHASDSIAKMFAATNFVRYERS
jgi:hypothetical protein